MAERVRVDPEKLTEAKNRMAELSVKIGEMQEALKAATQPMRQGAWTGEAFDAFVKEMAEEVVPARRALEEALGEGAVKLVEIGGIFDEAQNEARQGAGAAAQ